MTEEKKAGRPRIHATNTARVTAYRKEKRLKNLEEMTQAEARRFTDVLWKQHAKEIIKNFAECREFTKDRKVVIYQDKLLQFEMNVIRANAFLKISLGGAMKPTTIVRELDSLRSAYYHGVNQS